MSAPPVEANGHVRRTKADIKNDSAKPLAVEILTDGIPPEIRDLPRYVCWRWVCRDRNWTKPPINPRTGYGADSTDPETWVCLAEALAYVRAGKADGIGFCLGDGWAGIDLDDCIDPDTGDMDPWASAIVSRLGTYAEQSPSRTGCKMLVRETTLPPGRRKMGPVEFYDAARYFTLTGQRIAGTPAEPHERQAEVSELHAEVVREYERKKVGRFRAKATNHGEVKAPTPDSADDATLIDRGNRLLGDKFASLWDGSSVGYDSASEADLALCNQLAWLCGGPDGARVDALFRQSARMRDKWDSPRGESTYGRTTVAKAIEGRTDYWQPRPEPKLDAKAEAEPPKHSSAPADSWPEAPAPEAYLGLPGDIVRAIEPHSEADPAALLVQSLVAFGSAAGRHAHFRAEADYHYCNEFVVLVGKSAKGRKGTSWGQTARLYEQAEQTWLENRVKSGVSSAEGVIHTARDPVYTREKVGGKKGEPIEYQEVLSDPGEEDKRVLLLEQEFANVLKQAERQGNTLSVILRRGWECGDLQSLTKNSPTKCTGGHFSLIGHITADELRRYLTSTEIANGLGNRHLFVCVKRSKVLPEGSQPDAERMAELQTQLAQALAFARTAGEMRRDEDARRIWSAIYGELSGGKPGIVGSLLGRSEAHVMRLAMIYALMTCSPVIGAEHLTAALALWDYCERSVRYVFGDSVGDPLADELLRMIRGAGREGISRTKISELLGRNKATADIGRALGVLLESRLAHFRSVEPVGGMGRHAEVWFAGRAGT